MVAAVFLLSWGGYLWYGKASIKKGASRPAVAVTIFPLYDMVRNVAGDRIETVLVLPSGASPHTFEITVPVVKKIQGAKLIFAIGYGIDDWIASVQEVIPDARVSIPSEGIALRKSVEEEEGGVDPHYWLSIPNAEVMVGNIAKELGIADPENSGYYLARAENYVRELKEADAEVRVLLGDLRSRDIVTMHDAWYYFAEEYGLVVRGSFEPSPGKEPTQKDLIRLTDLIREYRIGTVFSEPQLSSESLKPFLRDLGISLAILDPEGSPETASYIELMRYNATTVYDALK